MDCDISQVPPSNYEPDKSYKNVYLLLLTMAILVQAVKSNDRVCKGDDCRVSPGNMEHLQDMLQSNRVVQFVKGDYHITPSSAGFIQVQDVVNLTIIGHGVETQILCSPSATFGFYFNNVSNLTISGLSVSSCSVPVPDTLINISLILSYFSFKSCPLFTNVIEIGTTTSSSFLVFDSDNVVLSNVTIHKSPGFAVVSIQTSLPHQHLLVQDCDMSFNTQGSLLLHRTTATLKRSKFISNNISLWSFDSELAIIDIYFLNSPMVFVQNQQIVMFGEVTISDQSPTCIIESNLLVKRSNVTFSKLSTLFVNNSSLEISSVSSVLFKEFSESAIDFQESYLYIKQSAKFILFNNTAYRSVTLAIKKSIVAISENATLIVEHNIITSFLLSATTLSGNSVTWNMYDNASVIFRDNKAQDGYIVDLVYMNVNSFQNAKIIFSNNKISHNGIGLHCSFECEIAIRDESEILVTRNNCSNSEIISLVIQRTSITFQNKSSIIIANNTLQESCQGLLLIGSSREYPEFEMDPGTKLSIISNSASINSFIVHICIAVMEWSGTTLMQENHAISNAVMFVENSQVYFRGKLECLRNTAESGAIEAKNSDLNFIGDALFLENSGVNGGAMVLETSTMFISLNGYVNFTLNHATRLGGAVYVVNPRNVQSCHEGAFACTFQVYYAESLMYVCFKDVTIIFDQNTAGIAGDAVYGGRISGCLPQVDCRDCPLLDFTKIVKYVGSENLSNLSKFTSDPTRVCFCEDGIPQCFSEQRNISVHPGELFTLSLATIGNGFGTVPGSVLAEVRGSKKFNNTSLRAPLQQSQGTSTKCRNFSYFILSEDITVELALVVDFISLSYSPSFIKTAIELQQKTMDSGAPVQYNSRFDLVFEKFFHIPIFVQVSLLPCPTGFQLLNGSCECAQIFLRNGINFCTIVNNNSLIRRLSSYWIGFPANNFFGIVVHSPCPYDYCVPDSLNITPQTPDEQCQFHRSGILCGGCQNGFSTTLGSSECRKCSNVYLILIGTFAVAGLVLVAFLFLLNLTVSVGTINGLIFYANIVQAISTAFLPMSNSSNSIVIPLRVFIAWVNLDLGIPTCFYNGMEAYAKTWLQFVFPLYILAIVSAIIIASHYSTWAVKVFGNNAVPVLATLFLLSYAKMLRILITAFSFTILIDEGNISIVVWLFDGNVQYFQVKHVIIFLVALLVLIVIAIPYTSVLILAPWIQKSKYAWMSRTYNKFKPLLDAYMGPYKDKHRYWMGLLLLVRVVLFIMFSSIANTNSLESVSVNLIIVILMSSCLLTATTTFKPYKERMNNIIESCYLLNLVFLSSISLYISGSKLLLSDQIYAYSTSVGVAFLGFLMVTVYHVYLKIPTKKCYKRKPPPNSQADERMEEEEEKEVKGEEIKTNSTVFNLSREPLLELNSM